jgi:DNA-binding transcriptional LysR family regulator
VKLSAVDLNLLVVFDAVMQERSVTRAGDRLGLSQPAMSHALARLRQMLKYELFIRSPKGMVPTPRAAKLAVPVRAAHRRRVGAYRPLVIRPLSHTSPIIETAMIWPRRLNNQPAHRWLREIVGLMTKGLRSK